MFLYNFNFNYQFLLGKNMQAESVILSQPFSPPIVFCFHIKFDTPKPFPTPSPPRWPSTQKRGSSVGVGSMRGSEQRSVSGSAGAAPAAASGDRSVFLPDAAGVDVSARAEPKGRCWHKTARQPWQQLTPRSDREQGHWVLSAEEAFSASQDNEKFCLWHVCSGGRTSFLSTAAFLSASSLKLPL